MPVIVTQSKSLFVVLLHEAGSTLQRTSKTHLDWMFELEGRLKTFATDLIDPLVSHEGIAAIALPDHRLHYLDFEGDISGGRGKVTRIASGSYELIGAGDSLWHARLDWNSNGAASEDRSASKEESYRMRSELRLEEVRGVLQLRLSATR